MNRIVTIALAGQHSIQYFGTFESRASDFANFMRQRHIRTRALPPCPCGYFGTSDKICSCTDKQISKHNHTYLRLHPSNLYAITCWVEASVPPPVPSHYDLSINYSDATRKPFVDNQVLQIMEAEAVSDKQKELVLQVANTICCLRGGTTIEVLDMSEAYQYVVARLRDMTRRWKYLEMGRYTKEQ